MSRCYQNYQSRNITNQLQWQYGVICVPVKGEFVCGDGWAVEAKQDLVTVMVTDGLGHGPLAASASEQAITTFNENVDDSPADRMDAIHGALRSTRGAAVAIGRISLMRQVISYCGIGNITGLVWQQQARHMVSHNGTVGHKANKIQQLDYPWPSSAILIMYSDGLSSQWRLDNYPGLAEQHPSLIAAVLYRDYKRGRDDATILVGKFHLDKSNS